MNTDSHPPHPGILQRISGTAVALTMALCCLGACGGDGTDGARSRGLEDTAATATLSGASTTDLPNVVLVAIDSFRPDHMNMNGYRRLTTAYLEELIPRAALFQNAYSTSPSGAPATASLLTSSYPPAHGVTESVAEYAQRARTVRQLSGVEIPLGTLVKTAPTLPEVLREHGYRTFGFSNNSELGEALDLFRGFDTFHHMPTRDAQAITRKVLNLSNKILEPRPTFLYLQFSDPQKPYHFRHPWFRNSLDPQKQAIAAYNSELGYVDRELLRLHEGLDWDRDTLLVIVSTHGEALWDHGQVGHGLSLHEEEMRTLFLIFGPTLGIQARTVQTNVSLVDVVPTILDLLQIGFEPPNGLSVTHLLAKRPPRGVVQRFRGRTLFGHRQKHRASAEEGEHHFMAVRGPWKLLSSPEGEALFHVLNDPDEQSDLLRDDVPPEAADLRRALASFKERNQLAADQAAPGPEPSAAEKIQELLRRGTGGDGP